MSIVSKIFANANIYFDQNFQKKKKERKKLNKIGSPKKPKNLIAKDFITSKCSDSTFKQK